MFEKVIRVIIPVLMSLLMVGACQFDPATEQEETREVTELISEDDKNSGNDIVSEEDEEKKLEEIDLYVMIEERQLLVDNQAFYIKGVCWNPVPKGSRHPQGLDFAGLVEQDASLMKEAGINTIRTYEPITDLKVLDTLYEKGIYVINTVYSWGGNSVESVVNIVDGVKDHPAILMWCIGNEWNYNGLYVSMSQSDTIKRINEVAAKIKEVDSSHPITTAYGNMPSALVIEQLEVIDVWGLNVYSDITFGDIFERWSGRSDLPMYVSEYGADAWDARTDELNLEAQAEATRVLTRSLLNHSVYDGGVCLGGTIFEFADEWWKDSEGSPDVQDVGGIAPGGGPYPDLTFNEEFWGIVDSDRKPRPAFEELKQIFTNF